MVVHVPDHGVRSSRDLPIRYINVTLMEVTCIRTLYHSQGRQDDQVAFTEEIDLTLLLEKIKARRDEANACVTSRLNVQQQERDLRE